jgi:hypothetical protein
MKMQERLLSLPKLLFVVGTRVALGAGVAMLVSRRMSDRARLRTGVVLALVGAITTIPAARLVMHANP